MSLRKPDVGPVQILKEVWHEVQEDNVGMGAASLAYFIMLSLFPAAIFLLTLLPYLPIPNLQQAIMDLLGQALPPQAADLLSGVVQNVVSERRGGLLSFGLLLTLWSGSGGMYAVMQQLDITYDVKDERPFWKVRGLAVLLLLLFIVLIIGAFALVVLGGVVQDWLAGVVGDNAALLAFFAVLRWIVILFFLLLGFALIYYLGPDVEQDFRLVTPGSLFAVVATALATLLFRLYVTNFGNYSATYGSLGAVITLMLWLYILGWVILLGAELNAVIEDHLPGAKDKGEKRQPR